MIKLQHHLLTHLLIAINANACCFFVLGSPIYKIVFLVLTKTQGLLELCLVLQSHSRLEVKAES